MSIVESRATQIPATTAVLEVPVLDITQTPSAGETAYFGGVQANWEEEASTTAEEEPTFKQLRLQPRELKGYTLASNSLLADNAIGLEALLKQLFAGAVAWHEDRAFLRGTGANQPLGVLSSNALISVTHSAASAVALVDVAGMLGRLLPGGPARSIAWVAHPSVLVKLLTMAATTVVVGNVFSGTYTVSPARARRSSAPTTASSSSSASAPTPPAPISTPRSGSRTPPPEAAIASRWRTAIASTATPPKRTSSTSPALATAM